MSRDVLSHHVALGAIIFVPIPVPSSRVSTQKLARCQVTTLIDARTKISWEFIKPPSRHGSREEVALGEFLGNEAFILTDVAFVLL